MKNLKTLGQKPPGKTPEIFAPEILQANPSPRIWNCIYHYKQFIIFSSDRPEGFGGADLYISFRNSDDTWMESLNKGIEINFAINDLWPSVTSDRKYFFFCRIDRAKKGYQPYWADAKIIEILKSE
jgi:hypothetical protein